MRITPTSFPFQSFLATSRMGQTYEEAVKQGQDLIESLFLWTQQDGKPLPEPQIFITR
jgi:predicted RNase H-like HicB family nuclease